MWNLPSCSMVIYIVWIWSIGMWRVDSIWLSYGLKPGEILQLWNMMDDMIVRRATLRRNLKSMRLRRRENKSDLLEVASLLTDQLEPHGRLHERKQRHVNCKLGPLWAKWSCNNSLSFTWSIFCLYGVEAICFSSLKLEILYRGWWWIEETSRTLKFIH